MNAVSLRRAAAIFLLTLTFLSPAFSQGSPPLRGACVHNSGESIVTYPIASPYQPRTFDALSLRYRSSSGWEVPLPKIVELGPSAIFYDDSSCLHLLAWDSSQQIFLGRDGARVGVLPSGAYTLTLDTGTRVEFSQSVPTGAGTREVLLSRISNRFGWSTEVLYRSALSTQIQTVRLDLHPASQNLPVFSWNFSYSSANNLEQIALVNKGGATVLRQVLSYATGRLDSIEQYGRSGPALGITGYLYGSSGPSSGLLVQETSPLGGVREFGYASEQVPSPTGAGTSLHSVLSAIIVKPGIPGEPDISTSITYQSPNSASGAFLGFASITKSDPSGGSTAAFFDVSNLGRAGELIRAESRDSNGALVTSTAFTFVSGGPFSTRRALSRVVSNFYAGSPSNVTTRGVEHVWNFTHDRLERSIFLNQAQFDPAAQQFTSDHKEDDVIREYHYAPDVPSLHLRNRIARWTESSTIDASPHFERRFSFDTNHLPILMEEWESESKTFRATKYSFDALGNIRSIGRSGGSVEFNWNLHQLISSTVHAKPALHETRYYYDPVSSLLSQVTEPSGISTIYFYDYGNRLKRQIRRSADKAQTLELIDVTYDPSSRLVQVRELGVETSYSVDGFGFARKASETPGTQGAFASATQSLNNLGQVNRISLPEYFSMSSGLIPHEINSVHGISLSYDATGGVASLTPDTSNHGLSHTLSVPAAPGIGGAPSVSPQGRTQVTGPNAAPSWYSNFSSLTASSIGAGAEAIMGFMVRTPYARYVTDSLNHLFYERQNSLGQVVESRSDDGAALRYHYDSDGRIERVVWPSGRRAEVTHDQIGRISTITYADSSTSHLHRYIWDTPTRSGHSVGKGQLASLIGPFDRMDFSYDRLGRVEVIVQVHTDVTPHISRRFSFEYDPVFGMVRQINYPPDLMDSGVVQYERDSQGRELAIYINKIRHVTPSGLFRTITGRNAAGAIISADYFNDLREVVQLSPYSNALTRYEVRRISSNAILEEKDLLYGAGRLTEQRATIGGHTLREQYTQVDSRPFLRQIVRQRDNNPPETISLDYDGAGRPLHDASSGTEVFYNPGSSHPGQIDGVRSQGVPYPWNYNSDQQLLQTSGPAQNAHLVFEYGPDGEATVVRRPSGGRMEITRGALGDIIRMRAIDENHSVIHDYRKFLFGLYAEDTDENGQTTAVMSVYGDTTRGQEDIVAELRFAPIVGFASPGGEPGTTPRPTPTANRRNPPVCPNGIIEPPEQCDGTSNNCPQPLVSSCVNCRCVLDGRPPTKTTIRLTQAPYDETGAIILDDETVWDLLYAALTSSRERYKKLYASLGIDVGTTGPCDKITLTGHETSAPDILTADIIVLDMVYHELAHELGLRPQYKECMEEVTETETEEVIEELGFWDGFQLSLDVGGLADPTPACDGLNCVIYLFRGKFSDAGVSLIGFIPYLGDTAKAGRLGETACRAVTQGGKITGRVVIRIKGVVVRAVKRMIPTGFFRMTDPTRVRMILGRYPKYVNLGERTGSIFFNIPQAEYDEIITKYGKDMFDALNREAIDLVAPLMRSGLVEGRVVLPRGQSIGDLFDLAGGTGTKTELFHLAKEHGLNVMTGPANRKCLVTGTSAATSSGIPVYLQSAYPQVNFGAYSGLTFGERYVPRRLRARLLNGEWLHNIERIRHLLQ